MKPTRPPRNGGASAAASARVPRLDRTGGQSRDEPPGGGERIGAVTRSIEDGDRIGGDVAPARSAPRPGTLEDGEAGQVAERLGHVHRGTPGDAGCEALESDRRGRSGPGPARPPAGPSVGDGGTAVGRRSVAVTVG